MPELPATLPPEQRRSRLAALLRPKVALPLLLLVLLLLTPMMIRGWHLRDVPDFPEPFDPAPLLSLVIPDDENAFTDYREATALYVMPSERVDILVHGTETYEHLWKGTLSHSGIIADGWHLADAEVKKWLNDNEQSMLRWKQGTQKSQALHVPLRDLESETIIDVPQQMRAFTRIVMVLCRKLEAEGKYEEAWEWYRASIRGSRHSGINGCVIDRLIEISNFSTIANQLEDWSAIPNVSPELLRQAIREIQEDWKQTELTSNNLKIEYISLINTVAKQFIPVKDWPVNHPAGRGSRSLRWALYLKGEPNLGVSLLRIHFYNLLLFCDQFPFERMRHASSNYLIPQSSRSQTMKETGLTQPEFDNLVEKSLIAAMMLPALNQFLDAVDREEIKCRTLLVTLAGQAFYRERRRFPDHLDELVPDYLDEVPIDTFDGKPLKYRYDPSGPVVYSVSTNTTDEGGSISWEMANRDVGGLPNDLGYTMRVPDIKPLRADKPFIPEDDDSE